MTIDAISHGQAAAAGRPDQAIAGSATSPAPSTISTVVTSGSSVPLMLAFQPAWQAAANSTARKTNGSIRPPFAGSGAQRRPRSASPQRPASLRQPAVEVEYGLQQHLCAGRALLLGGEFSLVVADAVAAGHKDHSGRRHSRHI